jgi:hypothetical protein
LSVAAVTTEKQAENIPNGSNYFHIPDLDNTSVGREITENA